MEKGKVLGNGREGRPFKGGVGKLKVKKDYGVQEEGKEYRVQGRLSFGIHNLKPNPECNKLHLS